jgi:hypothetical protein
VPQSHSLDLALTVDRIASAGGAVELSQHDTLNIPSVEILEKMVRMHMNSGFSRQVGQIASAMMAAVVAVGLVGCGGDSTPAPPAASLVVSPASFSAFANTPNTVTITVGTGPFTATSSDPNVLPVASAVTGASFTFSANKVTANTPVTLTVKDSTGATATVAVTVTPITISGLITVAPTATSTCAPQNNPALTTAALCSGEVGTASVTLRDNGGAVIANRPVLFEVLSAGATVAPGATSTAFGRQATVSTNSAGVATVAVKADATATTEAVFLRATDTVSSHRVDTWITTLLQSAGATTLVTAPLTAGVSGYYTGECSRSQRQYSIYGGAAPYAVTLAAGSTLTLTGSAGPAAPGAGVTVSAAGGTFVVEQPASTSCAATVATVTVTDSLGKTTAPTFAFGPGVTTKPAASTTLEFVPPSITVSTVIGATYCTSSRIRVAVRGGTAPYTVSTSIPQVTATLIDATNLDVSFVSDAKWKMLKSQTARVLVQDATGKIASATLSCI